jgi:hypothetical protein
VLVTQNFDTFLQPNKSSSHTGSTRNTTKHEHLYESNLDALSLDCVTIQDVEQTTTNHARVDPFLILLLAFA